jgi:predicted transposase YbfD/YdcC
MLLELLKLKGGIVTMGSTLGVMGTQRAIAQVRVDKGADYVLALKAIKGHWKMRLSYCAANLFHPTCQSRYRRGS